MASPNPLSISQMATIAEIPVRRIFHDEQTKDQESVSKQQNNSSWMLCLNPFIRLIRAIRQRRKERETCLYLMSLDDCFLNDLGINRADVVWAMRQRNPFVSPSEQLRRIARENRMIQIRNQKNTIT